MRSNAGLLLKLAGCAATIATSQAARGQALVSQKGFGGAVAPAPDDSLKEIVVTAQKRSENLQKVPIAATAIDAATITALGVRDLTDLVRLTPSLQVASLFGNINPQITIRGVGSASFSQTTESTVALYVDEFVLSPQSAKLGELFDLERVEVLRGPQGTLYGKNSTGGAINFITRKPDGTTAANGSVTAARFGEYDVEAGAQTALTDELSGRIAVQRRYRDGYGINLSKGKPNNNVNDWAGRAQLRYRTGLFDVTLKAFADRSHQDSYAPVVRNILPDGTPAPGNANIITGFVPSTDIDITDQSTSTYSNVSNKGLQVNGSARLGSDLTLTNVTGYLRSRSAYHNDNDGSQFVLIEADPYIARSMEFSQEVRLSSAPDGRFSWIAGLSFFDQTIAYDDTVTFEAAGLPVVSWKGSERTQSFAAFVDGTFKIMNGVSVVGGVRLTHDRKRFQENSAFSFVGPYDVDGRKSWTEPSYRMGVDYQMTPRTLLYISYSHGYSSGAFDPGFKTSALQFSPVSPEFVNNYEGGVKTTLFNNHLRLASGAYYMEYKDQQNVVPTSAVCCSIVNAGRSRIYGLELEGLARLRSNFDVGFSGSFMNGKFLNFQFAQTNYAGVRLQNTPPYEVRINPEYRVPLDNAVLFFSPEFYFKGKHRIDVLPSLGGQDVQRAYQFINARIGYRSNDRFNVIAFVKNATNKRYRTSYTAIPGFGLSFNVYNEPLIFGVTASFR